MNIIKEIGFPAMLEQCAEECTELAHVCLKLARKYRNDNPTPRTEEELLENLKEEIADVFYCASLIGGKISLESQDIDRMITAKRERWENRIREHKERK